MSMKGANMRRKSLFLRSWFVFALLFAACSDNEDDKETLSNEEDIPMSIQLTSSAFADGSMIPARYARRGENVSPPLAWSGTPEGTQSLALIVDDPDAPGGDWVHWIVYNLPAEATNLAEGIQSDGDLPGDAVQGVNGWSASKYDGPQPPSGTHRYVFKLYALDMVLNLKPGAAKADLLKAMEGHVLARGQLIGKYTR
jgi:Raf kinase inhibitor-like YbhB/YbcL family protein